jgi:hypothetical protein
LPIWESSFSETTKSVAVDFVDRVQCTSWTCWQGAIRHRGSHQNLKDIFWQSVTRISYNCCSSEIRTWLFVCNRSIEHFSKNGEEISTIVSSNRELLVHPSSSQISKKFPISFIGKVCLVVWLSHSFLGSNR